MGCSTDEFAPLMDRLQGRRIAFDRIVAVQGVPRHPRSVPVLVEELRVMLERVGAKPPFVLVGHSYGGLIARAFALRHRASVKAVVLVDPANERQFRQAPMPSDFIFAFRILPMMFWLSGLLGSVGALRLQVALGLPCSFPPLGDFPPEPRRAAVELYSHAAPWTLSAAELAGFNDAEASGWVPSLGDFDESLPVTAIVAARRDRSPTLYPGSITTAFTALAHDVLHDADGTPLTAPRRLVFAEQSDHWVHLQQTDLVAAEVERLRALAM